MGTEFPLRLCSRERLIDSVSSASSGNRALRLPPPVHGCLFVERGPHQEGRPHRGSFLAGRVSGRIEGGLLGTEHLVPRLENQPGSRRTAGGLSSSGESVPKRPRLTAKCTRNPNHVRSGPVSSGLGYGVSEDGFPLPSRDLRGVQQTAEQGDASPLVWKRKQGS